MRASKMTKYRGNLTAGLLAIAALTGCASAGKTIHTTANVYPAIGIVFPAPGSPKINSVRPCPISL